MIGRNTYRINIAPICLLLRVLKWVSINLTGTRQQKACPNSLCETQHIQGTHHICLVWLELRIRAQIHRTNVNSNGNIYWTSIQCCLSWLCNFIKANQYDLVRTKHTKRKEKELEVDRIQECKSTPHLSR